MCRVSPTQQLSSQDLYPRSLSDLTLSVTVTSEASHLRTKYNSAYTNVVDHHRMQLCNTYMQTCM